MSDNKRAAPDNGNVTLEQLIEEFVRTPEQQRNFLRTGWIHTIMLQLIHARCEAGLTQNELGERMGKQQSAIARLERGYDIKLSTLFDYLAALDLTPAGMIPVQPYENAASWFAANDAETVEEPRSPGADLPAVLAAD